MISGEEPKATVLSGYEPPIRSGVSNCVVTMQHGLRRVELLEQPGEIDAEFRGQRGRQKWPDCLVRVVVETYVLSLEPPLDKRVIQAAFNKPASF
jgi:hypothetical protein